MALLNFEVSTQQTAMTCDACGVAFMMPTTLQQERQHNGGAFYCPNGHARVYRETDVDRLRRELAEKERELLFERQRAATNYAAREAAEKALKKANRRASGGVCQCCNRSFVKLANHMKTKHPEFVKGSK